MFVYHSDGIRIWSEKKKKKKKLGLWPEKFTDQKPVKLPAQISTRHRLEILAERNLEDGWELEIGIVGKLMLHS